ncbi:MAG: endospore germination permease [Clostridia bacterium]|nr:endospore germination permease [Clostridia bacterium]
MKYKLKSREMTSILINLITVKMLFTYPRYIVERCLNGAWLSVIIFLIVAFGIFYLTQILYLKNERTSIITQAEFIGGKPLRIILGVFIITLLMLNIAPMVRAFPEAIKTALLQNTQMLVIVALLAIGVAIGAQFGIEALGRTASVFLPVAGIFILGFFIMLAPHYELTNIFPFSYKDVLVRGASSLSIFADIFVLSILQPYAEDMTAVKKSGITALLIGGITGVLIVLAYCLVYPYPVSSRFIVPMYQLTRLVKIGTYFQRLEAIFEFVWSISILIYTSIYLFIMSDTFKQCFGLRHHKPLVFPLLVILLRLVFWEESYTEALRSNYVNSAVLYPVLYILPLLIGIIYIVKRKRSGTR